MEGFLQHFECLGDNCEFGFVLIRTGVHRQTECSLDNDQGRLVFPAGHE